MNFRKALQIAILAAIVLLPGCRHKYANKIDKDTQQPDKVLFDIAIKDLEKSRFERARLTLQTLMNTYDTSEYMAKAKLAVADSWYRQGGSLGFAQAEAEYKDFILFYPNMEEAAEAQVKICQMQFRQMEKADRDPTHALRAEDECRQLITQFPNSKFAPEAQQMMRDIQEVLADKEMRVGAFYHTKGSFPAAANRLQGVSDQYPLYSKADEALWLQADAYLRMGDRFEPQQASAYMRIVRDYPLSVHVDEAKARLQAMNRQVPEADPLAEARMKYETENRERRGLMSKIWGPFSGSPDTTAAAKSGSPQMTGFRPTIPVTVPANAGGSMGVTDVGVAVAADPSAIDKNPDARANPPADGTTAPAATATPAGAVPDAPAPAQKAPAKKDNKTPAKK
jgi:outer membrane protein assembly factor BamD